MVFLDLLSKDYSTYSGTTQNTSCLSHDKPNHNKCLGNFEILFRFIWEYHLSLPPTFLNSSSRKAIRAYSVDCLYSVSHIYESSSLLQYSHYRHQFLDTHDGLSREGPMYHLRRYILDCLSHLCWNMTTIPSAMYLDVELDYSGPIGTGGIATIFSGVWRGHPIAIKSFPDSQNWGEVHQNVCHSTTYKHSNNHLTALYISLCSCSAVKSCDGASSDMTTSLRWSEFALQKCALFPLWYTL